MYKQMRRHHDAAQRNRKERGAACAAAWSILTASTIPHTSLWAFRCRRLRTPPISPGLLLQLSFVDPPSIITIHVHAFYLLPTPSVPAARATPARSLSLAHKFTCSFCNLQRSHIIVHRGLSSHQAVYRVCGSLQGSRSSRRLGIGNVCDH